MNRHATVWGLVPAAGSGTRFGGSIPKQHLAVRGQSVLAWTVDRLLEAGLQGLTVALSSSYLEEVPRKIRRDHRVNWVLGGDSRQASVAACLAASPVSREDLVLVHDAARPAIALHDINAVVEAARAADGAVLGRDLSDTLKRTDGSMILETIDRQGLFRAETPQVFRREVLERAIARSLVDGFVGTDESSLVERLPGVRIVAVAARGANPKLTEGSDWEWIRNLLVEGV